MITLTISNPTNDALIAAGFTGIRVSKSTTGTNAGPWQVLGPDITLVLAQTSYYFIDPAGKDGDWYINQFIYTGGQLSSPSSPQPGYLSPVCSQVRDLLGVSTGEVTDSQIQEYAYLPSALARIRQRFSAFDATVSAGGDTAMLCLGALAHLTAAFLCPRMTVAVVDSEQFKDYRYQRNRQMDWSQTQQLLLAQYEILISEAASETSSVLTLYPTPVIMAGPTSAGLDTSGGLIPLENDVLPYTSQGAGGI